MASVAFHRRLGAVQMPTEAEGDDGRVQFLLELSEPTSIDYYSVIDDDWPAARANLERRLEKHRRRQEGETTT